MKKIGLLILTCVLIVSLSAQDQAPQNTQKGEKKEFKKGERPMMTPQLRAEKMAKDLELTDVEKAKVQELFENQNLKGKERDVELAKILGSEKYQKFEALRAERKAKSEGKNSAEGKKADKKASGE
jgi:hypothetical protein